ncbi:polyprenal reductase [Takifugu rubripes]|nr:polyprenol reductase [Takifugu rubripes]|eukprot:XP_011612848.1 PREDICTED: polyprenol reductase [Takifugu rubripes]
MKLKMNWNCDGWSFIDVLWAFLALSFLVALCFHKALPHLLGKYQSCRLIVIFQDLIRYGKTKSLKRDTWLVVFDVPKRWFWHFYAISAGWNSILLFFYTKTIIYHQTYPTWLTGLLGILTGAPSNHSHVPQLSTLLVQLLLCIHSLRRLQECLCVSVFSNGVIHLAQYIFGLCYYITIGLTVLSIDRHGKGTGNLPSQLEWFHVAGCVLFIGASLLQHHSMILLAKLRTGQSGKVESLAHRVPVGGWFELVSCPHYFAELLIYISLGLVFGGLSLTWWLVVFYVSFNQALAAQLCHELYTSRFKSYPKHRKAFIPFLL